MNSADRIKCDICTNIRDVHINDWANHVKSRRHQSKCRAKNKNTLEKSDSFFVKCDFCNRDFTDEKFYNIHVGTKTHRRNLKKLGIKGQTQPLIAVVTTLDIPSIVKKGRRLGAHDDEPLLDFPRKKYKTRNVKTDDLNYRSYINSLAAFLSLRLSFNHNVHDFMISVNDKDYGAFGDIVVNMIYKDKTVLYAIQCKKVTQSYRQVHCLEELKLHIEKQYDHLAILKHKSGRTFGSTKFAIFSTYNTSSDFSKSVPIKSDTLNKWKISDDISCDATIELKNLIKKNDLINVTSDPENVYSFVLKEKIECELPYILLYTSQRIMPSMLNQQLKLQFDNYPDISKEFLKYIENWGEGKLGGNYKLRKKDIILKIVEILLAPYVVSPKRVQSHHDDFNTWNSVLDKVDLTVVKNELFVISKICQPLNRIIEETLGINIDTITKSVSLTNGGFSILDHIKDPIKSYLFEALEEQKRDELPINLVYSIFWKAGKIPLLLSSENQEECKGFILDVILFMKQMGVHKKFLLKTADLNLNHFKDHLRIFSSVEDIKDLVNLSEIKIRVSEVFSISLSTIRATDCYFLKGVTPNIFFDLSLGRYTLKPGYGKKPKKADGLKMILSDEVKAELERNLYDRTDLLRMNSSSYIDEKLRGIDPALF